MEEWILKRLDEIKSRFEEIEVLMTKKEIDWINDYHKKVYLTLRPYLDKKEKIWLIKFKFLLDKFL